MYASGLGLQFSGEKIGPATNELLEWLDAVEWDWVDRHDIESWLVQEHQLAGRTADALIADLSRFGLLMRWNQKVRVTALGRAWLDSWAKGKPLL